MPLSTSRVQNALPMIKENDSEDDDNDADEFDGSSLESDSD